MNICRLCLSDREIVLLLDYSNDIFRKIEECVSVKIVEDDDVPKTACSSCIQQIESWYNFRNLCGESNARFIEDHCQQQEEQHNLKQELIFQETDIKLENPANTLEDPLEFSNSANPPPNVYLCEICLVEFHNCFEYLDHQLDHNGEMVFQCNKCIEIFSTREDLVNHDLKHTEKCPICGKEVLPTSFSGHLIGHSDRYECRECSGRFSCEANLSAHMVTVHTDLKPHVCELCGKRFSTKSSVTIHLKSHSEDRKYQCAQCNYAGKTASALYIHKNTHANGDFLCEICSKAFKSLQHLKQHIKYVHTVTSKIECAVCGKLFRFKWKLELHYRIHTGEKPYSCKICSKAFSRKDSLGEHMRTHEGDTHDCLKCEGKFTTKRGLIRHNCKKSDNAIKINH